MPEFIAHRINTLAELSELPEHFGVELDLRDRGERLIIQHDPFSDGEDAEPYFHNYKHGTMILNIKSERIEWRVKELLEKNSISRYFFLDSSVPMIYAMSQKGEKKIAIRFSELEGLDTVMNLQGRAEWVWVDCFTKLPLTKDVYRRLKEASFKLCLVSPELQGRPEDIAEYAEALVRDGLEFDAICTKTYNIDLWRRSLGIA